jgi:4-amino-4-deoxy-L-arabinose transferase-like glycosyltransferase
MTQPATRAAQAALSNSPWPFSPGASGAGAVHRLLAVCCIGQVVLWGLAFGMTYSAPDVDSAEQFVWAFSLEAGYWKHPPLPSWVMHALLQIFGPSVVLPFVASQCCVVVALALVWRLGCELMPPRQALVAVLLTSLVAYHNVGADTFNHNTALLPFQAATILAFFQATRRPGAWRWVATGACAGLAMLVKYSAVLPVLGLLVYFVLDRTLHHRRHLLGLALAALVFGMILLPHALWLGSTHFLPFR